jgi:hypothetical protein
MTEQHVLFQDVVPYDIPSSLDALRGPATGRLTLPLHIWWAPAPTFDLADRSDLLVAYRAVVREGRAEDQEALLNRGLLLTVWPELRLPVRCREAWENAFPELAA